MRAFVFALLVGAVLGWFAGVAWPGHASAEGEAPAWLVVLVDDRAEAHEVASGPILRVILCESNGDPLAEGDWRPGRGFTSFGLAQLSNLPTGLLAHYHSVEGWVSAFDAWSSVNYLARVLAGEFLDDGISLRRWSCWGGM